MVAEVSVDELHEAHANGAYVVDVRESDEYHAGHVPGAAFMPLSVVPVRLQDLPTDQTVYVICQAGGRSMQAAKLMHAAGLDVRSVAGGTGAWAQSGRPIETGSPDLPR